MRIGDKVRFLNAVGGGIVKRFKNKEIVIVEEDDGFETPVLLRECIVVGESNETFRNRLPQPVVKEENLTNVKEAQKKMPAIAETAGGDCLNVFLAYLPIDIKNLGKCKYEAFMVNDSNYYLFFNYMSRQNNAWISRCSKIIEPNTHLFLEEFSKIQLNDFEKICIQFVAFKKNKPYSLKNSYSVELHLDITDFYKLHSFRENDFFEDEALIRPVVTNDMAVRDLLISASDWQEVMPQKIKVDIPSKKPVPPKKDKMPLLIEIDLHIHQLLDNTSGLNASDILNVQLDKFRQIMEENKNKKGQKIVFIHGKGEGVLRRAIYSELKAKYNRFSAQDASFKEYGFGATLITIR
jgi:hypothetical protein